SAAPALPSARARARSLKSPSIAAASAAGSPAGTRQAGLPSSRTSGTTPTPLATTGAPTARYTDSTPDMPPDLRAGWSAEAECGQGGRQVRHESNERDRAREPRLRDLLADPRLEGAPPDEQYLELTTGVGHAASRVDGHLVPFHHP